MKIEINAQGDLIEVSRLQVKYLLFEAGPDEYFSQKARSHSECHSNLQEHLLQDFQYPINGEFRCAWSHCAKYCCSTTLFDGEKWNQIYTL